VPEREPDYRFTLANERTVLAWLRTSLALMAAGVAVVQFAPSFAPRTAAGVSFAALSVLTAVGAVVRWRAVQVAMRRGEPLPGSAVPWVLGAGLAALGAAVGLTLLVT
jgi:putative membrane protein